MQAVYILALCWLATMGFLFYENHCHWKREYDLIETERKERKELINRLMARDFSEFVQSEVAEKTVITPQKETLEYGGYDLSDIGI